MKNFKLLTVCLLLWATQGVAQQSFRFKLKYLPQKQYITTMDNNMTMTLDIAGDEKMMAQIKSSGTALPMHMTSDTKMEAQITTGKATGITQKFPVTLTYKKLIGQQTLNGKEIPARENPLSGQQITGFADTSGIIKFDPVTDTTQTGKLKALVVAAVSSLLNQVKFPDHAMQVGETFIQEVPFQMPVPGVSMKMTIKMTYKLIAIENNLAKFDTKQDVIFNFNTTADGKKPALDGQGTGGGTGTATFDIKNSFMQSMQNDLAFTFSMNIKEMTMTASAKAKQTHTTVIAAN